jgi:hypothetical protein
VPIPHTRRVESVAALQNRNGLLGSILRGRRAFAHHQFPSEWLEADSANSPHAGKVGSRLSGPRGANSRGKGAEGEER